MNRELNNESLIKAKTFIQEKRQLCIKKTTAIFLVLFFFQSSILVGEQFYLKVARLSISVPDKWNTETSKMNITSTSQDGMASIFFAVIEPQKTKESLLLAAKIFTSEIEDFSFTGEGDIQKINGIDCFKIEGSGIINHSKISVSMVFYTSSSKDMIILASVYSEAYGEIYKKILENVELSVIEIPKR